MLLSPVLSFFALLAFTASVGAAKPPNFTLPPIFNFGIQVSTETHAVAYPYGGGQRVNIAHISGVMSTPANEIVATLASSHGGEQGVLREDEVLLVDVRIVVQAEQDRKFAFIHLRGKAIPAADGTVKSLLFMWVFKS